MPSPLSNLTFSIASTASGVLVVVRALGFSFVSFCRSIRTVRLPAVKCGLRTEVHYPPLSDERLIRSCPSGLGWSAFRPLQRKALRMKDGGRTHAGGFVRCGAAVAESTWIYRDSPDHTGAGNWSYDGDLYPGAPGDVE